jgi:CheY-like chemotaxis protein
MSVAGPDGINILVLEDKDPTRRVIATHLGDHLHELVRKRSDATDIEAAGALAHLLPANWGPYRPAHFDVVSPTYGELEKLSALPKLSLRQGLCEISEREFCDHGRPDILVVDLALSDDEQTCLNEQDLVEAPVRDEGDEDDEEEEEEEEEEEDRVSFWQDLPADLDIRSELDRLTGYRVLWTELDWPCVKIATTYAKSPLVAQHCLNNAAFAVVPKPLTGAEMRYAELRGAKEIERLALVGVDTPAVLIYQYLQTLAAEVLKAAMALAVIRLQAELPKGMSTDVIRHPSFYHHGARGPTGPKGLIAALARAVETKVGELAERLARGDQRRNA